MATRKRNVFRVSELEDIRYRSRTDNREEGEGDEQCGGDGVLIEDISVLPTEQQHRPPLLFDFRQDRVQIVCEDEPKQTFRVKRAFVIYGIVGAIQLISTRFLLVITDCQPIEDVAGNAIYKVSRIQLLKISVTDNQDNILATGSDLWAANQKFVSAIESLIQRHDFYYSDTFDLTSTMQRSHLRANTTGHGYDQESPIRNANRNFVWNHYLAEQLIEEEEKVNKINTH